MNIRNLNLAIVITLLISAVAWAPTVITSFAASNAGDYVLLSWETGAEAGVTDFRVERSLDGIEFQQIGSVLPIGTSSSYTFEDRDLYKSTTRTYYYRIRVAQTNGSSSFSPVQTVTLSFSGIQQTWGSIKSLFR